MLVRVQALCGVADKRVRGSAYRHYDTVHVQRELAAGLLNGAAAARGVGFAKLHFNAPHTGNELVLVAENFHGIVEGLENNALLFRVLDLLVTRGHFLFAAAVNYVDILRAKTFRAASCVHSDVAAADHRNARIFLDRRIAVLFVRFHQINACEELVRRVHSFKVLSGNVHKPRQTRARTDEDSLKALLEQLVHLYRAPDNNVCFYLYSESLKIIHFFLNYGFRQSELGDTVNKNAARKVQSLENRNIIAHFREVARAGKSRGSRADHRALVSVLRGSVRRFGAVSVVPIGDKAFQTPDTHGFAFDTADALAFALRFLRADASAHCGQRAALCNDLIRALIILFLYLSDKFGDIDSYGTARSARHILAVQAAFRLIERLLLRVPQRDLLKVPVADVRVLNGHFVLFRIHIRHISLPP